MSNELISLSTSDEDNSWLIYELADNKTIFWADDPAWQMEIEEQKQEEAKRHERISSALNKVLKELKPIESDVAKLYYQEGLSAIQIAKQKDITRQSVHRILRRVRKNTKEFRQEVLDVLQNNVE